jgi:hypothetical protein
MGTYEPRLNNKSDFSDALTGAVLNGAKGMYFITFGIY